MIDASNLESYEDVVELLVPVLQKRGMMWVDYTVLGGTYRENLHNTPGAPYLGSRHPGPKFKWSAANSEEFIPDLADLIAPVQGLTVSA